MARDGRRLSLLDGARWEGEPLPGDRAGALLCALATAWPHGLSDEALAAEVWPDEPPAHPGKALQVLVSRIRSRTDPGVIDRGPAGYRLALTASDVDALAVRERAAAVESAYTAGDLDVARLAARDALAIEVPPGDGLADGAVSDLAEVVRSEQARVRRVLGSVLVSRGESAEALSLLEPALTVRVDDEDLLADVLRAEADVRGVAAALERYAAYAEAVREKLGVEPGPTLRQLHLELLARDAPVRAGLHYDATPLIGRDEDVAALRGLLSTHRVVSMVGPGGLGKTRMAHLLGRLTPEPVVHFVELVAVRSPEGVLPRVAEALGVVDAVPTGLRGPTRRPVSESDLWKRVVSQFGAPTLLILDNCEQVVDAVADLVATLVGVTDTVRVLTTSRAPLGIASEYVYALPQLPGASAAELFGQRARAARPSVQLDPSEVATLVDRLDGLPLAIELAAAKTRVMSVAEITRRLDDRFALLAHGDRSAPDRHRTLEAVIEWSWNLLRTDDQAALRTLAGFPDGFSLDAAEHLLGPDAPTQLGELADQSLLVVQEGDSGVRYRFLETVREFGLRELAESGAAADVRAAIRRWAVGYAAAQMSRLFSVDQLATLDRVADEVGNLVVVLRGALDDGDASAAIPVMGLLSEYWTIRGDHFAMLAFTPRVLEAAAAAPPPGADELSAWRGVVAACVTLLTVFTGDAGADSVRLLRDLGEAGDDGVADAMRRIALLAVDHDDPREVLEAVGRDGNRHERGIALMLLGHVRENAGDLPGALAATRQALAMTDPADGPWQPAQLQAQLCSLSAAEEDLVAAARYAERALPVIEAVSSTEDAVQIQVIRILADAVAGRVHVAEADLARLEESAGDRADADIDVRLALLQCRAEIELARGHVDSGLRHYADAAGIAEEVERRFRRRLAEESIEPDFGEYGAAPWTTYTLAVVVFAHAYHGAVDGAAVEFAERLDAIGITSAEELTRVDFPVSGAMLVAIGAWRLRSGAQGEEADAAVRRIAMGRVFAYPRFQPVFAWAKVREVVEAHGRLELLDRLVEEFKGLPFAERLALARTL
ncbi:MAG TPA: BTAD domain-containing putative transcriptional regulator [Marmoricola sp.]